MSSSSALARLRPLSAAVQEGRHLSRVVWLHIRDKEALFVRAKGSELFMIPGALREPMKEDREVLVRRIKQDLGICLDPDSLSRYDSFRAPAFGAGDEATVENSVYFARALNLPPAQPDGYEVMYCGYGSEFVQRGPITSVDRGLMEKLRIDGHL